MSVTVSRPETNAFCFWVTLRLDRVCGTTHLGHCFTPSKILIYNEENVSRTAVISNHPRRRAPKPLYVCG